jgi:predicted amino acid dehydrogenase
VKRFAFIIHPLQPRDIAKQFPIARFMPSWLIEEFTKRKSPVQVSHITGIRSKTGEEAEGWFIGCPLTPAQMTHKLPLEVVYDRLVECTRMAENLGAEIIGLGAFTSVVGDGGITIRSRSKIGVTTGNSYTVATAIEGTLRATELLEFDPGHATLAVIGATGSIGKTCAMALAPQFGRTILVGRDSERTEAAAKEVPGAFPTTDIYQVRSADVIVTVTSSDSEVLSPDHLKRGAIVCDVARPRDVSIRVGKERPDVLVIEGGVVKVPGNVDFGFNFGFPANTAYACMSETMLLALEGDPSLYDFTLGKEVILPQVEKIGRLAKRHGFGLAGFRSFERAVDRQAIERARKARATAPSIPRGRGRSAVIPSEIS